jgi:hypothetical protein
MRTVLVGVLSMVLGATAFAQEKKAAPAPAKGPEAAPGQEKKATTPAAGAPGQEKKAEPAAAAAPAGPPKPAPELVDASKYFIGNWKCEGTQPAGPWGPGGKATSNVKFKMDMGNFFMVIDGDMKTDSKPPMKMTFKGMNGYDPTTKKMMRTDWDSTGGMATLTSPGWEGDKMVFTGETVMMGQKMKLRHTMTKKSDTEMTSAFETTGPDGKWISMGDDTCKKAGGAKK